MSVTHNPFARLGVSLLLAFFFSSCGLIKAPLNSGGTSIDAKQNSATITFSSIKSDVMQNACMNCHNGPLAAGANIDLSTYGSTLGYITPGSPSSSTFYTDLQSGRMPLGGSLSSSQIQEVSDWIMNGAPNDPPTLSGINPASGSEAGGTLITVSGQIGGRRNGTVGGNACTP